MRILLSISTLLCTLLLPGASVAAATPDSRQAQALWLSKQMHHQVQASQVLIAPDGDSLEGCAIIRIRAVPVGATAISLRCPAHALPQLVLLKLSVDANPTAQPARSSKALPLVRAGAALRADWRTASLHAELPVVALDSGASGAEIRVRVAGSNRIMRARILTARAVTILAAGA